jgi:hypothetical protein
MELSTGQQRLLFVVIVLLLAGLGVYLVGPGRHHGASASPTASASSTPAAATSSPAQQVPPATVPATSSGGGVNIYQWLPFTQQDLTEAAHSTLAFAADYETFSYTETAPVYAAKLAGLVTGELAATLQNAYAAPGAVAERSAQKQVSTSTGGIDSIRAFGSGSITFVVNIAQRLATTKGTSTSTQEFAVTLVSGAAGWEVNDIELAGEGNS